MFLNTKITSVSASNRRARNHALWLTTTNTFFQRYVHSSLPSLARATIELTLLLNHVTRRYHAAPRSFSPPWRKALATKSRNPRARYLATRTSSFDKKNIQRESLTKELFNSRRIYFSSCRKNATCTMRVVFYTRCRVSIPNRRRVNGQLSLIASAVKATRLSFAFDLLPCNTLCCVSSSETSLAEIRNSMRSFRFCKR